MIKSVVSKYESVKLPEIEVKIEVLERQDHSCQKGNIRQNSSKIELDPTPENVGPLKNVKEKCNLHRGCLLRYYGMMCKYLYQYFRH